MNVDYHEATESVRIEAVPLAHFSIGLGHLHLADLAEAELRDQFDRAAPWIEAAERQTRAAHGREARISTCFLVDDHALPAGRSHPSPADAVELLRSAARNSSVRLDYLAREAGCVQAADRPHTGSRERSPLADIVAGLIVEEPPVGANGSRPPTAQSGWLSNGRRSPEAVIAMGATRWAPPEEFGKGRHSVFLDAELWHAEPDPDGNAGATRRVYSCSLLSAVWQLLRLGLVRDAGRAVAKPYHFADGERIPTKWDDMPSVIQLSPEAQPFAAYRTLSILPARFRASELAVEVILDHLQLDEELMRQIARRAQTERHTVTLPGDAVGRMSHIFLEGS